MRQLARIVVASILAGFLQKQVLSTQRSLKMQSLSTLAVGTVFEGSHIPFKTWMLAFAMP